MADDVLTQARTPAEAEIEEAVGAIALKHYGRQDWPAPGLTRSEIGKMLRASNRLAAPRILALAYREAARHFRSCIMRSGDVFDAAEVVKQLEALATALEEGTR